MLLTAFVQNVQRYVADTHATFRFTRKRTVMRMTMQRQRGFMQIKRTLQTRASQKGKDGFGFADYSVLDRSVVCDGDFDLCV